MWSVAVIKGSSELELTQEEVENMDKEELKAKMSIVSKKFKEAGAHFVIETMAELEDILIKIENETINQILYRKWLHNTYTRTTIYY